MARETESNFPPVGRAETPQPQIVTRSGMLHKSEIALHQGAAKGLTEAGLGTFTFAVAEQQISPTTGKPVGEDSPFVVVTYSGPENGDKLWGLVGMAKFAKKMAEREGKTPEEIDQAVQDAIRTGIDYELQRKAQLRTMLDSLPKRSGM